MPLDPAFIADCPYEPAAILIDDIVSRDPATSTIVANLITHDDLPLTAAQRAHPVRHPRHVAGGLMVHLTGILGFVHAYHLLDLRHADGWIGYGTHIHAGRFRRMGKIGPPMLLSCQALQVRKIRGVIVARYKFLFTQEGESIYEAEHSAIFTQVLVDDTSTHT